MRGEEIFSTAYYLLCCGLVVLVAGIRSAPVYGKLDFLLLDGKPWWPEWRAMIEEVIQQPPRPILTDPMTSTVLRGVFDQQTLFYRDSSGVVPLRIEEMDKLSAGGKTAFPLGALLLLLAPDSVTVRADGGHVEHAPISAVPSGGMKEDNRRYRCLVNLQGFSGSWVPGETGHWWPAFADTGGFYTFQGLDGRRWIMEERLRESPPHHCSVYFRSGEKQGR